MKRSGTFGDSSWFLLEWIWNDRRWRGLRTRHRRQQPGAERHDANDLSQHSQQFFFSFFFFPPIKRTILKTEGGIKFIHGRSRSYMFLALFVCVILFSFVEETRMHFGFVLILFMGIPLVVSAFKNGKCVCMDKPLCTLESY